MSVSVRPANQRRAIVAKEGHAQALAAMFRFVFEKEA
jgi:hypothetical protein